MDREIKFRGKRKDDNQWIYGYLADDDYINNVNEVAMPSEEVAPSTIGQFTGLKDENATEIYEGDIISGCFKYDACDANGGVIPDQDCLCKGVVKFSEVRLQWVLDIFLAEYPISRWMDEEEDSEIPLVHFEYESPEFNMDLLEVIGNLYDNPELLKTE